MSFHRLFGNEEVDRDDLIGIAGGHLLQHLDLAVGQRVVHVVLRHFNRDLRWNLLLAAVHAANGLDQFFSHHILQ